MPQIEQVLPKYLQISNHIRDQILRGDLRAGDKVMSERELADEWNVSRPTAARALESLRRWGFTVAHQGSGTFVREQALHRRARERYGRARETGAIYAPGEYAVITGAEVVEAPEHVINALGLSASASAIRRQRVTYNESGPMETSISWFAADLATVAPRLLQRERIRSGTIQYLEEATGRRMHLANDRTCAIAASTEQAEALGLEPGTPVLLIHHIVYDLEDRPLEFAESVYPPGRWTVESEYLLET